MNYLFKFRSFLEGDLRTTLVIIQDQKKNIVAEGKSRQDSRDTDNKLKGQRVALANALKNGYNHDRTFFKKRFNKEKKIEIWHNYFNSSPKRDIRRQI